MDTSGRPEGNTKSKFEFKKKGKNMKRTLALQNALGTLCYINTLHPELLSTFTNYICVYYVEVQANPDEFKAYKLWKELKPGLMKGVEYEIDYNETIHREILRIKWRHNGEVKK